MPRHSPCALFSLNFVLNRKSVNFCYFVVIFLHPKLLRKTFYLKNHFSYRLLSCARFAFSPILFSMSFSIMLFALCPFFHLTSAKLLLGFSSFAWLLKFQLSLCNSSCDTLQLKTKRLRYSLSTWLLKLQLSLCNPSCDTLQLKTKRLRYCLRDHRAGGDKGIRTLDPLLAGQVLSQLSYTPILLVCLVLLVGSSGFEPPTSRLSGARSNHLSYEPA